VQSRKALKDVLCLLCSVDKPTKQEKTRMAQSIVARFPALKGDGDVGYVSFRLYM